MLPCPGIYVVKIEGDGWLQDGECKVDSQLAIHGTKNTIEARILDFGENFNGKRLRIYFIDRIRSQKEFRERQTLTTTIGDDKDCCGPHPLVIHPGTTA